MRKMDKKTIDQKVKNAAEILDLTTLLKRKPKQLSGGQRQRVALGRAIVREPKVFLMDEPLSNLDAKLRVQMRSQIKKLHEKLETTFIYVTHDQTEALTMGDRIVVLDKGVIQQIDTPENIYHNPQNTFVAGFIGSPQMNFLEGIFENGSLKVGDMKINLSLDQKKILNSCDARDIIIGIRPEKMHTLGGKIRIAVKVDMVEMLGSEKIAYFTIDKKRCSVKLPPNYRIDKDLILNIDGKDMFFFDKETKKRIQ